MFAPLEWPEVLRELRARGRNEARARLLLGESIRGLPAIEIERVIPRTIPTITEVVPQLEEDFVQTMGKFLKAKRCYANGKFAEAARHFSDLELAGGKTWFGDEGLTAEILASNLANHLLLRDYPGAEQLLSDSQVPKTSLGFFENVEWILRALRTGVPREALPRKLPTHIEAIARSVVALRVAQQRTLSKRSADIVVWHILGAPGSPATEEPRRP